MPSHALPPQFTCRHFCTGRFFADDEKCPRVISPYFWIYTHVVRHPALHNQRLLFGYVNHFKYIRTCIHTHRPQALVQALRTCMAAALRRESTALSVVPVLGGALRAPKLSRTTSSCWALSCVQAVRTGKWACFAVTSTARLLCGFVPDTNECEV